MDNQRKRVKVMLMGDLSIIVRSSQVYLTRRLSEYGINAAEEYILMYLLGHNEPNQDSIAKYFMLDKGSVARSLAKLESKGFIARKINDENQREKVITLTEKARNMREMLGEQLVSWQSTMYEGLSEEEIRLFENTVKAIAENIADKL